MLIEEVTFKNKPILVIKNEKGRIFFSAGLTKIRLILQSIDTLKTFAEKYNIKNEETIAEKAMLKAK